MSLLIFLKLNLQFKIDIDENLYHVISYFITVPKNVLFYHKIYIPWIFKLVEISHIRRHHAIPSLFPSFFSSTPINTTNHSFHIFSTFIIHFLKFSNINFLPYFSYISILTSLKMKTSCIFIFPLLNLFLIAISHLVQAQNFDISPAPTPTSDGKQIIINILFLFSSFILIDLWS